MTEKTEAKKSRDPRDDEIDKLKKEKDEAQKAASKHRRDLEGAANREANHVSEIQHLRTKVQRLETDMARMIKESS